MRRTIRTGFLGLAFAGLVGLGQPALASSGDNFNFRFSPLGLLIGAISADFDVAVGSNWTLGPTVTIWNFSVNSSIASDNFSVSALSFGARANWFKNGNFTDGLYVGPSVRFSSAEVKSGSDSASASLIVASALVGYGWFWDSFNMMLGGGLSLPLSSTKVKLNGDEVNVQGALGSLALEWTLGWTF